MIMAWRTRGRLEEVPTESQEKLWEEQVQDRKARIVGARFYPHAYAFMLVCWLVLKAYLIGIPLHL